jgi:SAM-dependent methyltransferase
LEPDWDKRYREGFYGEEHEPHEFVQRHEHLIPAGRPVIDIAMGPGADLLFLAARGFTVCGLEKSGEAIRIARQAASSRSVELQCVLGDALALPFKPARAGAVLIFYFLERKIMSQLAGLLAPGGILLYETFLKRQNGLDRPRDPEYLLDDGELRDAFPDLEPLTYEEGVFVSGGKQRAIARYAGRKG